MDDVQRRRSPLSEWFKTPTDEAIEKGAQLPKPCRCENPHTYINEDNERRCLCGRAARRRK